VQGDRDGSLHPEVADEAPCIQPFNVLEKAGPGYADSVA
jgi:hypothetical protein